MKKSLNVFVKLWKTLPEKNMPKSDAQSCISIGFRSSVFCFLIVFLSPGILAPRLSIGATEIIGHCRELVQEMAAQIMRSMLFFFEFEQVVDFAVCLVRVRVQ